MRNDYTVQALVDRLTLKSFTSSSSSLTPQDIVDLLNDSLRSYLVPLTRTLREEWWVGKTDLVRTTDADGAVTVPDSVASTLRTVSWNNAGVLTPLTRIEPELSFQYLPQQGLPVGFELRGYSLIILPKSAGITVNITAMLRPPQMVLDDEAGRISSAVGTALTLEDVPLAWQEVGGTPATVDLISAVSPFSKVETLTVVSLVGSVLTVAAVSAAAQAAITAGAWVSDVDSSPFANVPIELYPLLEADARVELFTALGDKRLKGAAERKAELEKFAKAAMGQRTTGNARPIVNNSAPGMRSGLGLWPRR